MLTGAESSTIIPVTLADFERTTFRHDGLERDVYRAVVDFARRVIAEGFTTYLPSLFGTPDRPLSTGYMLGSVLRACVAKEFTILATGRTSPIIGWLRALAAQAHDECGGPGVGAVGM